LNAATISLAPLRERVDDIDALAAEYQETQFVQIKGIFAEETAQAISKLLREQVPWKLIYVDGQNGVVQLSQQEAAAIGPQEMQRRMGQVMQLATRNIGFCYKGYHMTHAVRDGVDPGHPVHEITKFLSSREFIDFGEKVIGVSPLTQIDAQASLFDQGSFLTRHVDEGSHNERRAAYTLSFCPNWQTDWGGLLQFIDRETTDVTSAWVPRWNTLTIFDGRRVHSVSPISSFAGDGRYSIVGWFRDDPV
ncbi:MAG: 2OG-Fe(II) oxygenase family protein, partial [Pseudomonadota bacterium]